MPTPTLSSQDSPNSVQRLMSTVQSISFSFSSPPHPARCTAYDDGRTQLLLCLHGTLPITYRQATYNIPVAIWITREYPKEHPIAYVVATSDMLIRSGQCVDLSGRCNIEYIQNWRRKSEGCNLIGLVEAMQVHFSKEPPVYAKPKDEPTPKSLTSPASPNYYSAKPPPPLPGSQPQKPGPSPNTPLSSAPSPQFAVLPATDHPGRPALPPKPGTSSPQPITASPPQIQQPTLPQTWDPPRHTPSPPSHHPPSTHYQSMQVPANPTSSQPGYHVSHPPPLPPSLTSSTTTPPPPPSIYPSLAQIQHQIAQPVPPPPPPPVPPAPSQIYPQLHNLMNQHIAQPSQSLRSPPPNLMDADDPVIEQAVPPPPVPVYVPQRPPNPELLQLHAQIQDKLTSEFASLSQAMALDAERLRAHQVDLLTGEPAIRDEMARLEAVRDVCRGVSERLRYVVTQGEANIIDLRNKGDPPVDELLCSTTIVYNQLVDLIAEDNAIEDTMYHLHRALNAGRIDLERFLRTTRTLAEEQFMKRALIEKIQTQAPIGGWA
ncbi:UEV-domain-containing protein [Thelephora ganbajun]|uniref:UEV-domain-containing protein n=1 Tax=Thelephora ganbajun TaxID=370292 RepID=A0ACB6ZTW4_THEGA|nr:UEV-domain-containing protein [Thelephora ganbajun]